MPSAGTDSGTGSGPDRNQTEPAPEPNGTDRYSVTEAAALLSISERAVRKRIAAGTLHAERIGGRWRIHFDREPEPDSTSTGTKPEPSEPLEARYQVTPAEIEQAIERTGRQYTSDLHSMFEQLDALYRDQIDAKDALIDELRRRAETAEAERDRLRSAPPADSHDSPSTSRHWWQLWRR